MVFLQTLSDPQFISQEWKSFCQAFGATVSLSSGFQPQTNGQTERTNQDLESALCCVTATNPSSWYSQLNWIECALSLHLLLVFPLLKVP